MRAVLDPNILISALLSSRGAPAQLLIRWLAGEFELVVSEALLAELEHTLTYPKLRTRIPRYEADRFVEALRRSATLVADAENPERRSADPNDDYLLALAEAASAILVSGDRHILDLTDRLPVQSAQGFLADLEEHAT